MDLKLALKDYRRYLQLRSFDSDKSFLFAAGLPWSDASFVAKSISKTFDIKTRIECLRIGEIRNLSENKGEIEVEFLFYHAPNFWAVTLDDSSEEGLAALFRMWDSMSEPFADRSTFIDWFDNISQDTGDYETDQYWPDDEREFEIESIWSRRTYEDRPFHPHQESDYDFGFSDDWDSADWEEQLGGPHIEDGEVFDH